MSDRPPRTTIGMPIRNGGDLLPAALRSVLEQTDRDLEIILSDNASTDGSSELMRAAAAADPRVRYVRHDPPLRVWDHFRWVLQQARGEYFMWAAHDDTRDRDFVERLAAALDGDRRAVLAFGDLVVVSPHDPMGHLRPFPFATAGLNTPARLAKLSRLQCFYIYGLWRTTSLRSVPHETCDWWPDLPLVLGSALLGTFVHVPGTAFRYYELVKTGRERVALYNYTTRFNLLRAVVGLITATFRSCREVGGTAVATYAAGLVTLKQVVAFPGFAWRRLFPARQITS